MKIKFIKLCLFVHQETISVHCVVIICSGIKAEVLVVQSFEELKRRASEARGRIVVFNQPFISYEETVSYRGFGASEAAKVGAVATLIRSVTPFSINRYLFPFYYLVPVLKASLVNAETFPACCFSF